MVVETSTVSGSTTWVSGTTAGSTADTRPIIVTVDVKELEQYRKEASASMHVAMQIQQKMDILEAKFNKAIEILTSRGINITELI